MTFSSNTPITAGGASGSSSDYTRTFKKYFGDRPTAFALSERTLSPTASSSFSSSSRASSSASFHNSTSDAMGKQGRVWDPFAAAAASSFSSSSHKNGARGNVDSETHNALQNLGWRIRSRINQGYSRSNTFLDPFGSNGTTPSALGGTGAGFVSERDILANSRRGWSRVKTAPTFVGGQEARGFDDLRKATTAAEEDECMDATMENTTATMTTMMVGLGAVKRSRGEDSDDGEASDDETTQQQQQQCNSIVAGGGERRRIAALPKLSFSSFSSSTTSSVFSTWPSHSQTLAQPTMTVKRGRAWGRSKSSSVSPFTTSSMEDEKITMDLDHSDLSAAVKHTHHQHHSLQEQQAEVAESYDFSTHFNNTDF